MLSAEETKAVTDDDPLWRTAATGGARDHRWSRIHGPNAGCWAAPAASAVAAVAAATVAGGTAAAAAEPAVAADADSSPVTPGRSGRAPGDAALDWKVGSGRALEPTPSPVHEEFDPTICPVRSSNILSLRATALADCHCLLRCHRRGEEHGGAAAGIGASIDRPRFHASRVAG